MAQSLQNDLNIILQVQELDIKMIRLMRVKNERQKELRQIDGLRKELHEQLTTKQTEIEELNQQSSEKERRIEESKVKLKALDERQNSIKKIEEFNALTQEMTMAEREKIALENQLTDLMERKTIEEEILEKIKESQKASDESSKSLDKEINVNISLINKEGSKLKTERDSIADKANEEIFAVYSRLLRNKRDRVLVPLQNRACSGCHIVITPQHENLVRKGENLVFCEHCSRIHYWPQETERPEGEEATPKRRRRRLAST